MVAWSVVGHADERRAGRSSALAVRVIALAATLLGGAAVPGPTVQRCDPAYAGGDFVPAYAACRVARARMIAGLDLAEARWRRGEWDAALAAVELAHQAARFLHNRDYLFRADVQRVHVQRSMMATEAAEATLTSMLATAPTDCDRALVHLQLALLHGETEPPAPARKEAEMEAARDAAKDCNDPRILPADTLAENMADARFAQGDLDGAIAALDDVEDDVATLLIRARVADRRGDLAAAAALLERARDMPMPDEDWAWEVEHLAAQVADVRGDLAAAEATYRRAIALIGELRRGATDNAGTTVARYRPVYDGLIALLARQRRWHDALDVVLDLDASDMLRHTAARDHDDVAKATMAGGARPTVDELVAAWRGRELVIVSATGRRDIQPGGERVYRLWLHDGQVDGADVGDAAQAKAWAADLYATPGDVAAGRGLGAMTVPPATSPATLDVLLVGELGRAPLAALRDDAGLVLARRPLARVLGLRPRPPAAVAAPGATIVLADPQANLPAALVEGRQIAARLAGTLYAQTDATSARLWAAAHADVLHIAAHVGAGERDRVLRLADRAVTPAEIVAHGLAPRLAVLASCGAAAAHDQEGWGSLAQALLVAGTDQVIAADRSVDDAAAAALVLAFYARPDWRTDPARALAAVQVASASAADPRAAWAAFTILAAPPRARP